MPAEMADNADSTLPQRTGSTRDGSRGVPVPAPAVGTTAAAPLHAIRAFVTDLFAIANPAAPLAERLRPTDHRRGDRPASPARAGQAAGGRVRVGQAAFDDPVGAARRGQDDARAADGRRLQRRVHRAVGGPGRRQGHPRRGRARRSDAGAVGTAHDPLRRRSAPLQQGPAGRVPAVRRSAGS